MTVVGCAVDEPAPAVDRFAPPPCASSYAHAIYDHTREVISRGSVAHEHYVTEHNRAQLQMLLDGPQIFPAFRELIASATHEVDLQTYVWEPGSDPANEILDGLAELARRRALVPGAPPVTVRFLFDASTSGFGSRVDALPEAWASVLALRLDPARVRFELSAFPHAALGALHVKTLVVDGREAIITGANPQAHHDYATPWRDAGFRLSGEVALALRADFDDAWSRSRRWICEDRAGRGIDICTTKNEAIDRKGEPPPAIEFANACQSMLVVTRQADTDPLQNRIDNPQDQGFLAAFAAATRHIHMQTPNLNDDAAKQALVDAVVRGVQVDIVLSKGFNDSTEAYPGQGGTNAQNVTKLYASLAAAGIAKPCDRMRFRWYAHDGAAVVGNGIYASHAKYASVDDAIVIVGTANMDTQSWNNSREVNVIVDDSAITKGWDAQMFARDFAVGIAVDQCR